MFNADVLSLRKRLQELGDSGDPQAVPELCENLLHDDPSIRLLATSAIQRLAQPEAVGPLIDLLKNESNLQVKHHALFALGALGGNRAKAMLQEIANSPNELEHIREVAIQFLAEMPSDVAPEDPESEVQQISETQGAVTESPVPKYTGEGFRSKHAVRFSLKKIRASPPSKEIPSKDGAENIPLPSEPASPAPVVVNLSNVLTLGRRARSFCLFQVSPEEGRRIGDALAEETGCRVASIQDLPRSNTACPEGLVIIDATWESAAQRGDHLYRLLATLSQDRAPLWVIGTDRFENWRPNSLWLEQGRILEDGGGIDFIDREQVRAFQFFHEMKRLGPVFPFPELLDFSEIDPPLSHIEKLLAEALEEASLRFQAGAKVGPYHVDFLVSHGDRRVVVECDGMTFHSGEQRQARDRARDEAVREMGYTTLRFTSHQLMRSPSRCAMRINCHLKDMPDPVIAQIAIDGTLDGSQLAAVKADEGRMRLLAPAGAGKTKTLINRICQLVNMGHEPNRILALAFNKKAAEEMKERLKASRIEQVKVLTFHALGNMIGKKYLGITFIDKNKQGRSEMAIGQHIRRLVEREISPLKPEKGLQGEFLRVFTKAKDTLAHPYDQFVGVVARYSSTQLAQEDLPPRESPVWQEIFNDTIEFQEQEGFYTFSDMVYLTIRGLARNPAVLGEVQSLWDTILVDEFQDLNPCQLQLVDLLATKSNSLLVVGDDDQTINSFAGANLDFIRFFGQLFPGSDSKTLSTNYRCGKRLVRHANYLIRHNMLREPKNIQPFSQGIDGTIEFVAAPLLVDELEAVVSFIRSQMAKPGRKWRDIGIISRTSKIQAPLQHLLRDEGIPFEADTARFFTTAAAESALAYFQAIIKWPDVPGTCWAPILKIPNKFLPYKFVDEVAAAPEPLKLLREGVGLRPNAQSEVSKLLRQIEQMAEACKGKPAMEIIGAIDAAFNLTDYHKEQGLNTADSDAAEGSHVYEGLHYYAMKRPEPEEFLDFCASQADEEKRKQDSLSDEDLQGVQLLTIHSSKGKEWKSVVVFHGEAPAEKLRRQPRGISEQRWRLDLQREEEEERRVYYVAMTRAKEALLLTAPAGNVIRFFSEFLKHPGLQNLHDKALRTEHVDRIRALEQARDLKERLERELVNAKRIADPDETDRLVAVQQVILDAHVPPLLEKQRVLAEAEADLAHLAGPGLWASAESIANLVRTVGLVASVEADAIKLRDLRTELSTAQQALAARQVFENMERYRVWTEQRQLHTLRDALGVALEAHVGRILDAVEARERLTREVNWAREDLATAEASRSTADNLKTKIGLVPAKEQELQRKINELQTDLRRHERESQLAIDDIRKAVRQKLEGLDTTIRVLSGQIEQLARAIESSVRAAINGWATETGKLEAIVAEADSSRTRVLAAQSQAVRDCGRLIQEIGEAQQAIVDGVEGIHEVEFEIAIREQLARQAVALGAVKSR